MAHKTLIGGTAYEIGGGKTLIGGTAYAIKGGKTMVGGTVRNISFDTQISTLSVGSSVFMNVSEVRKEFIVVHQGLPSSVYDSSCDGTWLMMKHAWNTGEKFDAVSHDYADSSLHFLMDTIFYGYLDSGVKSAVKQVELPCHYGTLTARVFSLSYTEVGFSGDSYAPVEGAVLSYFNGAPDDVRIARYNGDYSVEWWLRTPRIFTVRGTSTWAVYYDGTAIYSSCTKTRSTRPAFILRSDTLIDENFNVIA